MTELSLHGPSLAREPGDLAGPLDAIGAAWRGLAAGLIARTGHRIDGDRATCQGPTRGASVCTALRVRVRGPSAMQSGETTCFTYRGVRLPCQRRWPSRWSLQPPSRSATDVRPRALVPRVGRSAAGAQGGRAARQDQPHPRDRSGEQGLQPDLRSDLARGVPQHRPAGEGPARAELLTAAHFSLPNYIAQVSGQAPNGTTQTRLHRPPVQRARARGRRPEPRHQPRSGRRPGLPLPEAGCGPPRRTHHRRSARRKYPPNPTTHLAAWRSYNEDMGNDPARDGGTPDPTGGTTCAHPAVGGSRQVVGATATDQYAMRHSPFLWFRSTIDKQAECDANVVPLGTLRRTASRIPRVTWRRTWPPSAPRRASASSRPTCATTRTTPRAPGPTARAATTVGSPRPTSGSSTGCR